MAVSFHEAAVDLPHEYYPAIGEFIFRYAQLEYLLHELIWRCLDIDNKQGRALTIGADISVLMGTLAMVTSPDGKRWVVSSHVRGEVGNVVKVAKDYKALRNQLAHGTWQHPPGDKPNIWMHYMKETYDQRLVPTAKRLPSETMHKASGKLKATIQRAKRLIAEIEKDRPPQAARAAV